MLSTEEKQRWVARALARERALYEQLLTELAPHTPALQRLAAGLADIGMVAHVCNLSY